MRELFVKGYIMSAINIDVIVALFVIANIVLLAVSLNLGKSQPTLSLDDLAPQVPDSPENTATKS
ncbi:MAG: hypothetical protein ACR2OM_06185 [Aestuariivirgaceae bacterium]